MISKEFDFLDEIDSKEALRTLRTSANTYCQHNDTQCKVNKELYEIILKDLEILEILKPFVKAIIELKEQNINVLDFNISDNLKEKIKEWVEGK